MRRAAIEDREARVTALASDRSVVTASRWVAPPPPPPRRKASLRARRGILVEVAAAAVLLVVVATLAGRTSAPASIAAPITPAAAGWDRLGVPAVTALIQDVTAAEADTGDVPTATVASLTPDAQRLGRDLTGARRLPAPPGVGQARAWRAALGQLTTAQRTLADAAGTLSPAAVALAHQQLSAGAGNLLELGQSLTSGP